MSKDRFDRLLGKEFAQEDEGTPVDTKNVEHLRALMAEGQFTRARLRRGRRMGAAAIAVVTFIAVSAGTSAAVLLTRKAPVAGAPIATSSASSSAKLTPSSTPTPSVSASLSPTVLGPSVTPSPSPSFLPAIGPPCSAPDLQMRLGQQYVASQNGIVFLIFTDRGSAPCTLQGTPEVQFLDASGDSTGPTVQDEPSGGGYFYTLPTDGVGLIPLGTEGTAPGPGWEGGIRGQASLPLQYDPAGCANSIAAVEVTISSEVFSAPLTIGGQTPCNFSNMSITPFQPAEFDGTAPTIQQTLSP